MMSRFRKSLSHESDGRNRDFSKSVVEETNINEMMESLVMFLAGMVKFNETIIFFFELRILKVQTLLQLWQIVQAPIC